MTFADLRPGEIVTVDWPCYRRWWQFWKPKQWTELRTFRVGETVPVEIEPVDELYS